MPFPISVIADTMTSLTELYAQEALESDTPDSAGRSGAVLTNYWLENLNTLHPQVVTISMTGDSSTRLEFDATFPILHSDTLTSFEFSRNGQLYPSTMPNDTLRYLPQLQSVTFSFLTYLIFPLTIFEYVSSTTLSYIDLSHTNVVGTLDSLKSVASLGVLWMSQSNLSGELPQDFSSYWPQLIEFLADTNLLSGPVPSFANLSQLVQIDLHSNALTSLPNNFLNNSLNFLNYITLSNNELESPLFTLNGIAPELQSIDISHNRLVGELSTLFTTPEQVFTQMPSLTDILLNNNNLVGTLPLALWSLPPNGKVLLNSNDFSGSIPSPSMPTILYAIALDNNPKLSGPFPQNLTATKFTLSYTALSGPVSLSSFTNPPTESLNLAFTQLSCPLDLSKATSLVELDIQSAGFGGCDVNNQTEMNVHWDILQILDISNNAFKPFVFTVHPTLTILQARSCGVTSFAQQDYNSPLNLQSIIVDNNVLTDYVNNRFERMFVNAVALTLISFQNCSLTIGFFQQFIRVVSSMPILAKLLLSSNLFIGEVPFFLFADSSVNLFALPTSIEEVDFSNNPGLTGHLPPAASSYTALQVIDFSGTSVIGSLPENWSTLVNLQRLSIDHTQLVCSSQDACPLPSWLSPSTFLTSPSTSIIGAHCPQLLIRSSSLTVVSIDENYYHHSLCTCDEKYFGAGSTCQLCPNGCSCVGNQIQNCFPIVTSSSSSTSDRNVISIPFIISCPLTVTGESLCNPNNIRWNFNSSTSDSSLDVTSFCYTGHTGRGCTKCMDGYFASGRWCLKCGSSGLHIFIVIINLGLLILLIGIIYSQLPAPATAIIQMENYFSTTTTTTLSSSPSFQRSATHRSHRASTIHVVQQNMARSSNSPLKLLIFHSQQLGLILQTATSQPQVITGFFSIVSSGSTGFSLSSLISVECLNHSWSIQQQVWMSLLAPTLVGLACIVIYLYQQYRRGRTSAASIGSASPLPTAPSNSDPLRDTIHLGVDSSSTDSLSSTTIVSIPNESITHVDNSSHESGILLNFPRMYGVCLALLYFFLFPCAQTVLSAIACTDTRQYDGSSIDPTSSLYLNLLPWIACDSIWRSRTLPPAIIGVILWIITFPIVTTMFTRYLIVRIRVSKDIQLWPLCADLFTRFKPQYWYYEQILLARRLSLILSITVIPADSLYLPVTLFSIIQFSALIQHLIEPYQSVWLNRGELVSLYLLLLNYITALVLHQSTVGGSSGGHSLDTWSVILFLANLLFVVILICGLFLGFRTKLLHIINRIVKLFNPSASAEINHVLSDSDASDAGMIELKPYHTDHIISQAHIAPMVGTVTDSSIGPLPLHDVSRLSPNSHLHTSPSYRTTHPAPMGPLQESKEDELETNVSHDIGLISTSI